MIDIPGRGKNYLLGMTTKREAMTRHSRTGTDEMSPLFWRNAAQTRFLEESVSFANLSFFQT